MDKFKRSTTDKVHQTSNTLKDSTETLPNDHIIYKELDCLENLFHKQAAQISTMEKKLREYSQENKRLKERISEVYNKKLMNSLNELNLTKIAWCDDKEFFDKIGEDEIRFDELFTDTVEGVSQESCVSELVEKFVLISHTVINF